mmetsp:Transcript_3033/g.7763  ORF Transcript_3033/g.7763 Transcript_3033/m.7763 type:complete len:616 (-) Transcript_3033:38-1885(-)
MMGHPGQSLYPDERSLEGVQDWAAKFRREVEVRCKALGQQWCRHDMLQARSELCKLEMKAALDEAQSSAELSRGLAVARRQLQKERAKTAHWLAEKKARDDELAANAEVARAAAEAEVLQLRRELAAKDNEKQLLLQSIAEAEADQVRQEQHLSTLYMEMDALQERVASSTESMLLAPADVLQATPPPPPPPQPPPQVPLPSYGQHPVQPVLQQPEITVDMHTGGRIMCELAGRACCQSGYLEAARASARTVIGQVELEGQPVSSELPAHALPGVSGAHERDSMSERGRVTLHPQLSSRPHVGVSRSQEKPLGLADVPVRTPTSPSVVEGVMTWNGSGASTRFFSNGFAEQVLRRTVPEGATRRLDTSASRVAVGGRCITRMPSWQVASASTSPRATPTRSTPNRSPRSSPIRQVGPPRLSPTRVAGTSRGSSPQHSDAQKRQITTVGCPSRIGGVRPVVRQPVGNRPGTSPTRGPQQTVLGTGALLESIRSTLVMRGHDGGSPDVPHSNMPDVVTSTARRDRDASHPHLSMPSMKLSPSRTPPSGDAGTGYPVARRLGSPLRVQRPVRASPSPRRVGYPSSMGSTMSLTPQAGLGPRVKQRATPTPPAARQSPP